MTLGPLVSNAHVVPSACDASTEKQTSLKYVADQVCVVIDAGNAHVGKLPTVRVRGKAYEVCWRSLFIFPVNGHFRQQVLLLVEWKWFDRFILFLILVASLLLAAYQHRASEEEGFNWAIDNVLDPILTAFFTVELVLKVIAWGFFLDRRSYLRDFWNWLDFIVVVTALISYIPRMDSGLGFLRLFRILRPLRSLNQLPQMKVYVNTLISAVPRLANVTIMMLFCFWIFGIMGISLLEGTFYHGCRSTPEPLLRDSNGTLCWEWPYTGDDRLCGGRYMCDLPPEGVAKGYCGGREDDPNKSLRPSFPGGMRGLPWCVGSEPKKVFPETDFVHFDHIGGALLTVFQCTTMEGWSDIMYYVQDGFGFWAATLYFFTLIPITSFFLLNVALAVVDEAREEFEVGAGEEPEEATEAPPAPGPPGATEPVPEQPTSEGGGPGLAGGLADGEEPWWDCAVVRALRAVAFNEVFVNFIMFFIAANVVTMMLEQFPPQVGWQDFLTICEKLFLGIFCAEMIIMIGALGPKAYLRNPGTCFDGFIVAVSLIQALASGSGSSLTALRTLRLFRVLSKLAHRWPSFRVLLKAMVRTGISLNYWLVLFFLILFIITLMCMSFFSKQFHFQDLDSFSATSADQGEHWCAGSEQERDVAFRQDCIPRAHFDTPLWAFVTVFQIMTGENWNWIMYAGMRARHWIYAVLFILVIVFGQILFLSLFLSMLMSKFDKVQDSLEKAELERRLASSRSRSSTKGLMSAVGGLWASLHNRPAAGVQELAVPSSTCAEERSPAGAGLGAEEELPSALPGQPEHACDTEWASPKTGEAGELPNSGQRPQDPLEQQPTRQAQEHGPQPAERKAPAPCLGPLREPGRRLPHSAGQPEPRSQEQRLHEPREQSQAEPEEPPGQPGARPAERPEEQLRAPQRPHEQPWRGLASTPEGLPEAVAPAQHRRRWPDDYAWFLLSEANPLRRACRWALERQVEVLGNRVNAFDSFILLCILISTVFMGLDYPLRNPADLFTKILRKADTVFAVIFMVEMVLKLLAMGLLWGHDAYLKSGWNWLDGIVVCVSFLGMIGSGSGGFLKTLRILRALRPLRVISRNRNLKVVVQTIFASLPALLTLVIVCAVFLLIFALFALSYLNGTFFSCQAGESPTVLSRHLGTSRPSIPLCLSPNMTASSIHSACPRGMYQETSSSWIQDNLGCPQGSRACAQSSPQLSLPWERPTADTPICVGRCKVESGEGAPPWLCPRRYEALEELPSNCGSASRAVSAELLAAEQVGEAYKAAMTRVLVMPCAGSAVDVGGAESSASAVSCRSVFCPKGISSERVASCEANCRKHPHFCASTCRDHDGASGACRSCRSECQAACECEEYCEPFIKDAALCYEQGGQWVRVLPQNFDNIWNSLLTLFEISSTEAWVDVMYAACDATEAYEEPIRDHQQWIFAPFFVLWIFFSFMFLLNLSVGVIVDSFMDLKQELKKRGQGVLLTAAQQRWISSRRNLLGRPVLFSLTNLHRLSPLRRRVYGLVSNRAFEAAMTGAIVANTLVMACKVYPSPTSWWEPTIEALDHLFALVFAAEFALKYFALRRNYWMDGWNRFDFACVVAALVGIILSLAAPAFEIGRMAARLFRTFRIARLFRLLRSKRLNNIFMALLLSLPKLGNVLMILLLLLTLYGILGVSLFSTVKHSEYLNQHGNFFHLGWAFITLFRAVTGEAWNSIMHDLLKNEIDFFREGTWCTPDLFFDASTEESFNILDSKCLIDKPNSCVQTIWGWNVLPAVYWVTYILIICLMVMNLVIAVILEGYEDGKTKTEAEVVDLCIVTWRKYDVDQKMTLPLPEAMQFIKEVNSLCLGQERPVASLFFKGFAFGSDISRMPMKCANAFELAMTQDNQVDFLEASKQILRFTCIENDVSILHEIQECEALMDKKEVERLRRLEVRRSKRLSVERASCADLRAAVAAIKLQRYFRRVVVRNRKGWVVEEVR